MAEDKFVQYGDKKMPLGNLTLEQGKQVMARYFPELADPKIETKKDGDKTIYTFSKKAGHKGRRGRQAQKRLLAKLGRLPRVDVVGAELRVANETKDGRVYARAAEQAAAQRREIADVTAALAALGDAPTSRHTSGSVL